MILDETLQTHGYQVVSLSQFRIVTTEQQLTEEQLKPFWDQVKHKKMSSARKDSDAKKQELKKTATQA